MQVVWFKRDLRLHDHAALHHAAAKGPVLCVTAFLQAVERAHVLPAPPLGDPTIFPPLPSLPEGLLTRSGTGLQSGVEHVAENSGD